jgi:phosphoglycerate dehydrogenase-like enzyme
MEIETLLDESDIISFHVHATSKTFAMVNEDWFSKMKPEVLLINTARGDIINEKVLVKFLRKNPSAFYATDVLANEINDRMNSPILCEAFAGLSADSYYFSCRRYDKRRTINCV